MIKICQARSALGCILENLAYEKDFLNLNQPKVAYHGMTYFIF
jgi:hypothetical protein